MIYIDCESCGLHSMAVLFQYAEDEGPVHLYSIWKKPIKETLALIEGWLHHPGGLCFFNAVFDFFHIAKIYTIFSLFPDKDALPEDHIDEIAELEPLGCDGPALKAVSICDIMLWARKGPYQSTMDRGDIRIRRIPTDMAWQLATELERRIPLKDIYFARRKDKHKAKWQILDVVDSDGELDPSWKDVVCKFAPSAALKVLATDALGLDPDEVLRFSDVDLDPVWRPEELGYAPFAKAIGSKEDWKNTWPDKIRMHISHWAYHETARKYACNDVDYTRSLYKYFGEPAPGDDDSELAAAVAVARWKGFKVDLDKIKELKVKALAKIGKTPMAPKQVKHYVNELFDPTAQLILKGSTKKVLLEEIAKLTLSCPKCGSANVIFSEEELHPELLADVSDITTTIPKIEVTYKSDVRDKDCICKGNGYIPHPAASRAQEVLDARAARKEIENYDKLITAGRFFASFKITGSLSNRMSGDSDLNAQGIKKTEEVRSAFPLAFENEILCGGDFSAFEVTLAVADYNDKDLERDVLTCEACEGLMAFDKPTNNFVCESCKGTKGKKIHAIFATFIYPGWSYEEIKATEKTADDKYTKAKSGLFSLFYGGNEGTLQDRLGVELEVANKAYLAFTRKYKMVGIARKKVSDMFNSMTQPGGIGSRVIWQEPHDYIESIFGFRRYFTLENIICKALFDLAEKPPKSWKAIKIKVVRRDRVQTGEGATRSALFGAAFSLQASNTRAAMNHRIQSSGATITKRVQRKIWDLQPVGVHEWLVRPINIHDELQTPCHPSMVEKLKNRVIESVEEFREQVPLIRIEWKSFLANWSCK